MYKKILVAVDNSVYSNYAMNIGINLAKKFGSIIAGIHVYAASLHDNRFKEMEKGLPQKYQEKDRLEQSRKTHGSLITKGLAIISDSYLDIFEKQCHDENVKFERKIREGKNFAEIVKEIKNNNYDLIIMGCLGLGATDESLIGSTVERVIRIVNIDMLVVKNNIFFYNSHKNEILVGIDGSNHSFSALRTGITLAKNFESELEAVTVFDPYFHIKAFQNLVGVLSDETQKVFKFKEQENLHDETINKGLENIYLQYLTSAYEIVKKENLEIKTTMLKGKPFVEILKYIRKINPIMIVVGRFGMHHINNINIGATAENLIRLTPCNILITTENNGE